MTTLPAVPDSAPGEPAQSTRRRPRARLAAWTLIGCIVLPGLLWGRVDGFTLREWWRDCHSGVVRWQGQPYAAEQAGDARAGHTQQASKQVALTFDDGPDPRYTPRVLDILARAHVRATFFVEGRFVQAHPALARRIVAEGHVLGNHTFTHPYLNRFAPPAVAREMDDCTRALQRQTGVQANLFRPPRGLWNPAIYQAAQQRGLTIVLWTAALEHANTPRPAQMAERVLQKIRAGGIVLMHDGGSAPRETTVQALPLLLDGLRARHYRCVTVPQLLDLPPR